MFALSFLFVLSINAYWAYDFKERIDEFALKTQVYESLERKGKIRVSDMSQAPFGLLGWKLFPYYLEVFDGRHFNQVLFLKFVDNQRLAVRIFDARDDNMHGGPQVLASGEYRIGARRKRYEVAWRMPYFEDLAQHGQDYVLPIDWRVYRRRPFPLNNTEWNEYIRTRN